MVVGSMDDGRKKRRKRLTAILLGLLALSFYLGFIGLAVWSS